MERKMYEPTQKQIEKWAQMDANAPVLPDDEHFKARGKKERKPWGILKRDWILSAHTNTSEYQRGLWQGRVDCAQGLPYSEERSEKTYNLGYYRGYTEYQSRGTGGWDLAQAKTFKEKYAIQ